jgi:hypothetical protein
MKTFYASYHAADRAEDGLGRFGRAPLCAMLLVDQSGVGRKWMNSLLMHIRVLATPLAGDAISFYRLWAERCILRCWDPAIYR